MPTTTVAQKAYMAEQLELNNDTVCSVYATKLNATTQLNESPDLATDTAVGTNVPCDIYDINYARAQVTDTYLQALNIGVRNYREIHLPLSFAVAHPTISDGWWIVSTDVYGTHIYTVKNVGMDESEPLLAFLDCEATQTL